MVLLEAVNAPLTRKGQSLRPGTIVDATRIATPGSTKSADHARDPEMHHAERASVVSRDEGAHRRE